VSLPVTEVNMVIKLIISVELVTLIVVLVTVHSILIVMNVVIENTYTSVNVEEIVHKT
jgi:hypothetical protein